MPSWVEIAPYVIVDFKITDDSIILCTNLNYEFILDINHSTRLIKHGDTYIPIATVRGNIEGFFNRNTYYNLVEIALNNEYINDEIVYIPSNKINHPIGKNA